MAEFSMEGGKLALLFGAFLCSSYAYEVSVSCMIAYDEGGASAVFDSPECPMWEFSAAIQNGTDNCPVATHRGRRKYQEDRIICYPHVTVPVLGSFKLYPLSIFRFLIVIKEQLYCLSLSFS